MGQPGEDQQKYLLVYQSIDYNFDKVKQGIVPLNLFGILIFELHNRILKFSIYACRPEEDWQPTNMTILLVLLEQLLEFEKIVLIY